MKDLWDEHADETSATSRLAAWHEVYAGLSDDEIAEVEAMAQSDRSWSPGALIDTWRLS